MVFLSTHILSEAELISDSVRIMMNGELSDSISTNTCTQKWQAKFAMAISDSLKQNLSEIVDIKIIDKHIIFEGDEAVAKTIASKINQQDQLYYLAPVSSKLEKIYMDHTVVVEQK